MLAFEPIAKPLLFLHLVAAACVTGSAIHLAIRVFLNLSGQKAKLRQERLYARLLLISYSICFLLGALIYPTYRVRVRAEFLDAALPWTIGLFEIKEHFASVGMVAVVGTWILSRCQPHPFEPEGMKLRTLYVGLLSIAMAVIGYNVVAGWYLTTLRAV